MAEFEEYNQRYYESRNLHADISRRDARTILLLTRPSRGERILDLGCGLGHYCNLFASYGASVVGVDISNYAISNEIGIYGMNSRLGFVCQDVLRIDYNEEFDKVPCSHIIEHLTLQERGVLLQNIFNALKQDVFLYWPCPCSNLNYLVMCFHGLPMGQEEPIHLITDLNSPWMGYKLIFPKQVS
jgi:2-polyprenyl-3-methyl-5-hydroxy-6-metoxy-1,4-benzoquinol methylase